MKPYLITYDQTAFGFEQLIKDHFEQNDLSQLHDGHNYQVFNRISDQSSLIHKKFYQIYEKDDVFLSLYRTFIKDRIQPNYNETLIYQTRPTFRIHMPSNLAVGEFHKDSDYNHQRAEITHWMPFTPAFDTNTIWIESEEDKGDYESYKVDPGEVLVFPAAILRHGNKINETEVSRISMDFRIIPYSKYNEMEAGSSHLNIQFKIGGYYSLMEPNGNTV